MIIIHVLRVKKNIYEPMSFYWYKRSIFHTIILSLLSWNRLDNNFGEKVMVYEDNKNTSDVDNKRWGGSTNNMRIHREKMRIIIGILV